MSALEHLAPLERALTAQDFPAMSGWWRSTLSDFYASGKRQFVLRVGRRGGKSTSLCRVAVLEGIFGDHHVPPGDVGVVAIVSVSRDEASQRLRTVKAILGALGVKYRPIEGGVELEGRPVAFKVYAASVAGVSGFTCITAIADEVAKWRDSDNGSNPATEVLASLRPTMAGQPNAKLFLSSSPMGKQDAHAKAFDEGDTDFQMTASAPTWIARPTLTEAECRSLEPDDDTFQREYGAVPFDGSTLSIFTEAMLRTVTRDGVATLPPENGVTYVAAQDPANRGGNEWSLAIARESQGDEDRGAVQVVLVRGWRARKGVPLDSDATMGEIAEVLREYRINELWQDQWSFDALKAIAARHDVELLQEPMTQVGKVQMFDALKRKMTDGAIELPDDAIVRSDLIGVRKWISRNGAFSIELERQNGRHSDHAQSVALVVSKAASSTPSWARAMDKLTARTVAIAESRVEETKSLFGDEFSLEIAGVPGRAVYRVGDREPRWSIGVESNEPFKARIRSWWKLRFGAGLATRKVW